MGKTYTPPDISDELYSFLNPGDAFMLRGLVAKWNGIASNCIRPGANPEAVAQSQVPLRDPVAALNETERRFQAKATETAPRPVPAAPTPAPARVRPTPAPIGDDRDEYRRWAQVTSPEEDDKTLVLKYLLQGNKTIHELNSLIRALKPTTGDGVIPAILWRFGKIDVIRKASRARAPKYTISDGFWADAQNTRSRLRIR